MTHSVGQQRWTAAPSSMVTKLILDHREDERLLRRLYSKIDFGFAPDDCHVWLGALSSEGYGDFSIRHRTIRAHRVVYIIETGQAPADETPLLDHINCIGRFCVNRKHLEEINNTENTKRGRGVGATQQRFLRQAELAMRDARRAAGESWII